MSGRVERQTILAKLRGEVAAGRSILVVGAGNGLVARCAEDAGADLVVVYNSGFFRLNGLPSLVGLLPVGDANAIMMRLGRESIVPARRRIPIIAGVYGVDPTRDVADVLDAVEEIRFSGVINFPTIGRFDGQYRKELEAAGLGFANEVEMIRQARARELLTLAYVYTPAEAALMAEAGVDVIVGHMGLTSGGDVGAAYPLHMDDAVRRLQAIFDAALAVRDDLLLLSHGGPISDAADAEYVNLRTSAMGFVAASSFERIPVEVALKATCDRFKSIRISE